MTQENAGRSMKTLLRADLRAALKAGAAGDAALLRALIAAIDNAEAPPFSADQRSAGMKDFRAGAAEVARLDLDDDRLQTLFAAEIAEREAAASQLAAAGADERAKRLLDEIDIVRRYAASGRR
jgi:uncharacterized protein YqeY